MDMVYEQSALQIKKLEDELKRLNVWSSEPIAPEKLVNMGAFGSHTMAFTEWLQFVLIPRVQAIIDEKGQFPATSNVSVFAFREFDGWPEAEQLLKIVSDFDALFN
ncbi:MAG: YqcC family protein [Sphingobacteriales bacterium]|nr:YqcC family protein [Sphingobacteriales bacterium]